MSAATRRVYAASSAAKTLRELAETYPNADDDKNAIILRAAATIAIERAFQLMPTGVQS